MIEKKYPWDMNKPLTEIEAIFKDEGSTPQEAYLLARLKKTEKENAYFKDILGWDEYDPAIDEEQNMVGKYPWPMDKPLEEVKKLMSEEWAYDILDQSLAIEYLFARLQELEKDRDGWEQAFYEKPL